MKHFELFLIFITASLAGCGLSITASLPVATPTATPLTPLTGISSISAGKFGRSFSCAVTTAGALLCWGDNSYGQLGDGTQILRSSATATSGMSSGVTQASLGSSFGTALKNGFSLSWGRNSFYELGDGTLIDRLLPVNLVGLSGTSETVSAGAYHVCALHGGTTFCWGQNQNGQLGNSTTTIGITPVQATNGTGTPYNWSVVATGINHTCSLEAAGNKVYCWGDNIFNQIGDGTGSPKQFPTATSILTAGVTDLSAGVNHTCAIMGGNVYCWGSNYYGQLGLGTVVNGASPALVPGITSALKIYSGGYHTCASVTGGTIYCWGKNDAGQLGTGAISDYSSSRVTVQILSQSVSSMALGINHTCAVMADTTVQCWGNNGFGQLGNGTTASSLTPVTVQK
jgi:alpha-tubulin suppressor-like RCC1 family protein